MYEEQGEEVLTRHHLFMDVVMRNQIIKTKFLKKTLCSYMMSLNCLG